MSLDIQYRPSKYADVRGQDDTKKILKQYIIEGKAFEQSYLFCGERGNGKTTLGRIHARAMLCEQPVEGEPCDQCVSCLTLLKDGSSMDYIEVDAATNSGKDNVKKITEDIEYDTFSGRQRIYLFDEAHQLSKEALDALLKPMEDPLPDSNNKRLVCIFCTTEPEKMRSTVLSRCAPAFVIEVQTPEVIADRLFEVCGWEGIPADMDALRLVAEITECHIRDAFKAVEGISMLGGVTRENVARYLHLDLNLTYLELMQHIGSDLPAAFACARKIMARTSPVVCYGRLAEAAMLAYRTTLGERPASYWDTQRLADLGAAKQDALLGFASRFASRPGRPSAAMLMCDIALLHHGGGQVGVQSVILQVAPSSSSVAPPTQIHPVAEAPGVAEPQAPKASAISSAPVLAKPPASSGTVKERQFTDEAHPPINPLTTVSKVPMTAPTQDCSMPIGDFCNSLVLALRERRGGQTR